MFLIRDSIGSGGWVMAVEPVSDVVLLRGEYLRHLFRDQLGRASVVLPLSEEELSQEGVEGLLLISVLLTPAGILLLQGGKEPFQDQQGALLRVWLFGWRHENRGVFCPVGGKLDQGLGRENKWRSSQRRKVPRERGDGFQERSPSPFVLVGNPCRYTVGTRHCYWRGAFR